MKYLIYTILLTSLINFSFANEINSEYLEKGFSDIHVSPSGKYLVFSKDDAPGIYLFDIKTNDAFLIGHGIGSAYHASFSQDERYIGFKLFKKIDEKILQVPALYDFENKKIIELAPPSSQTGIPSFSDDEKVAFTVGTFLILKDLNTSEERKFELPNYSNLTPLSPDGSKILFNDMDDQICLFDLDSNESRKLTTDDTGYYEPIWSPDGSAILMSSFGGNLNIYDFSKNEKITLGPGNNPQWINNGNEIIFSRPEFSENREVVNMDLYSTDKYGDIKTELTSSPEWESFPAYNSTNNTIYLADRFSGKLLTTTLYKQNLFYMP